MAFPQSASKSILKALIGDDDNDHENNGSLFAQLKALLQERNASLAPSPTLNSILSRLVSLLQGKLYFSVDRVEDRSFSEVQHEVCKEIDGNQTLRTRAEFIRDLSMNAEYHLELHHVKLMLLKKGTNPDFDPVQKIRTASESFPYVDHYVEMVDKESEVIAKFLSTDHEGIETPKTIKHDPSADDWQRVAAFCGSGPLPFTGILMAVYMKVRVVLIDCDEEAVDLSRKLIAHWEKEQVLPMGVVTVTHAKAEDLYFYNPEKKFLCEPDKKMIPCHILFIAGLIANDVKHNMVRKLNELQDAGPLVVMRTAHGLTARFAYYRTCRKIITQYLNLVGIVAPETHLDRNGFIIDDEVRPIDFFPTTILNSLEIYTWHQDKSSSS